MLTIGGRADSPDRRQPWGFQVSASGSRDERSSVPILRTISIPNEMDLPRRRFPPPGPNPSNSIPLTPRDEFFLLDAESSVSARGRSGSLRGNLHPFTNPSCPITDALRDFPMWFVLDGLPDFEDRGRLRLAILGIRRTTCAPSS